MPAEPIRPPVVVLGADGDLTVHEGVAGAEAALAAAGAEVRHLAAYDALGDRLTVRVEEAVVEAEGEAGRPTRRALLTGRVASAWRTRTTVRLTKEASPAPAEPWVRGAIESELVDAGVEEELLEDISFAALVELARERL